MKQQKSNYEKLKPIHKEIFDQLGFAEHILINSPTTHIGEDHSSYANRQFRHLYEVFEEEDILSFAKVSIKYNLFDFNSDGANPQMNLFSIVAHYRSELDRRFELLNQGYELIFSDNFSDIDRTVAKAVMDHEVLDIIKNRDLE